MSRRTNLALIPYAQLQKIAETEKQPALKGDTIDERENIAEYLITTKPQHYFYDPNEDKEVDLAESGDDEDGGPDDYDYTDGFVVKDGEEEEEAPPLNDDEDEDYLPSKDSEDEAAQTTDEETEEKKKSREEKKRPNGDGKKKDESSNKKQKTI